MPVTTDNYQIQVTQAKKLFLKYNQQELIERCRLTFDQTYLYTKLLGQKYRIRRDSGDMERLCGGNWVDGNSFGEVMTLLDWLCDSKAERFSTGRWVNIVNRGPYFHRNLQENGVDPDAAYFDKDPRAFCRACETLGGKRVPGADVSYAVCLVDDLGVCVQLWHGDEEFSARLRFLWDENALQYLRYETTWYALGLLRKRLRENI